MPITKILTSLGITVGVSLLIATGLSLFGLSFWNSLFLVFALHFVAFGILNYITGVITRYKLRALATQELEILNSQSAPVQCAKCGEPSMVPIVIASDENEFSCVYCSTENKIIISAEALLKTTPISTDDVDTDEILKRQIKKLEENE